ncbi:dehydrogenase [Mesorhizobium sp. L-8-10]|uniref:Gfo/Idh/MocA family protein n=1 Tax=Mesorhizobium sp. L-8-10 TaxID=2744523 RepID=UPI00192627BB|nr:Gfo/Idh/MocA family oxidoreductase [Mesorhizobium sp. L-8-10]BCH35646.1 dehydrogenase [Mesorhizobium sp. L-8-10]
MTIRIAILGVAHYHANFWTRAIQQSPDAEIAGIWDGDNAKAAEFAARYGVAAWYDLPDLIAKCDAVAVCSATSEHVGLVRAAAAQGRPVLCEKPLGKSLGDCDEIAAIVAEAGIPFMQSFPKRLDPINHEIATLLREGAIGQVTLCRIRHGHSHGFSADFRAGWFVDPALSGGGTLLDEGVHAADFLCWMFGMPETAFATVSSSTFGLRVEDTAAAIFRYAGGLIAEVTTSWAFAAADASIEIYGTEGSIVLGGVDIASRPTRESAFLRVFRKDGDSGAWTASPTVPHFKTGVFHEHVAWAFIKALKNGGPMPVTIEDGHRAFALIDAAYRSVKSGRAEPLRP